MEEYAERGMLLNEKYAETASFQFQAHNIQMNDFIVGNDVQAITSCVFLVDGGRRKTAKHSTKCQFRLILYYICTSRCM